MSARARKWVKTHTSQFGTVDRPYYDVTNMERIKRFKDAPDDYIDERIELNKEVLKNYHTFYQKMLLIGFEGVYIYLLVHSAYTFFSNPNSTMTLQDRNFVVFCWILAVGLLLMILQYFWHLSFTFFKTIGLLRVIRDSEIEIYYLSLIRKDRKTKSKAKLPVV